MYIFPIFSICPERFSAWLKFYSLKDVGKKTKLSLLVVLWMCLWIPSWATKVGGRLLPIVICVALTIFCRSHWVALQVEGKHSTAEWLILPRADLPSPARCSSLKTNKRWLAFLLKQKVLTLQVRSLDKCTTKYRKLQTYFPSCFSDRQEMGRRCLCFQKPTSISTVVALPHWWDQGKFVWCCIFSLQIKSVLFVMCPSTALLSQVTKLSAAASDPLANNTITVDASLGRDVLRRSWF